MFASFNGCRMVAIFPESTLSFFALVIFDTIHFRYKPDKMFSKSFNEPYRG